ncbi:MAG: S-methyl-5-thioribose-1-phosphate isomerase [Melioribacteraceae bacterium]|nr:S-methyl-5-thioribose-1-phosphate isomerase [Melioribacteraceae bacterium]
MKIETIKFNGSELILLDQTKLPFDEVFIVTSDYNRIAEAIERLEVRGAPAIGVTAAYSLAIEYLHNESEDGFYKAYDRLKSTRPTAVNLFNTLQIMIVYFEANKTSPFIKNELIELAHKIHQEDFDSCERIAQNGIAIFNKPMNVITHCNAGALATAGEGTALSVIKYGFRKGLVKKVFVDETRPLLQGSRLTAYELDKEGIPFEIITDSMAASIMKDGEIDIAITGADRIALNGDSANKIGTYSLAINCKYHNLPFYIAAPESTFDPISMTGDEFIIEQRAGKEISSFRNNAITKETYNFYNPSFDVTPAELIVGIITDKKLYRFPYNFK